MEEEPLKCSDENKSDVKDQFDSSQENASFLGMAKGFLLSTGGPEIPDVSSHCSKHCFVNNPDDLLQRIVSGKRTKEEDILESSLQKQTLEVHVGAGKVEKLNFDDANKRYMSVYFNDLDESAYCCPPVFEYKHPGEPFELDEKGNVSSFPKREVGVDTLHRERRGEHAEEHTVETFSTMFIKYGIPSFIIHGYNWKTQYLDVVKKLNKNISKLSKKVFKKEGEIDLLISLPGKCQFVVEVKAVDKQHGVKEIVKVVTKAFSQCAKTAEFLSKMIILKEPICLIKVVVLPNCTRATVNRLFCMICRAHIISADDLSGISELNNWFKRIMGQYSIQIKNSPIQLSGHLDIIGRLIGPASLSGSNTPIESIERTAEQIGEHGGLKKVRGIMKWNQLTPQQLPVKWKDPKFLILFGPPGSGKTLLALSKAKEILEGGNDAGSVLYILVNNYTFGLMNMYKDELSKVQHGNCEFIIREYNLEGSLSEEYSKLLALIITLKKKHPGKTLHVICDEFKSPALLVENPLVGMEEVGYVWLLVDPLYYVPPELQKEYRRFVHGFEVIFLDWVMRMSRQNIEFADAVIQLILKYSDYQTIEIPMLRAGHAINGVRPSVYRMKCVCRESRGDYSCSRCTYIRINWLLIKAYYDLGLDLLKNSDQDHSALGLSLIDLYSVAFNTDESTTMLHFVNYRGCEDKVVFMNLSNLLDLYKLLIGLTRSLGKIIILDGGCSPQEALNVAANDIKRGKRMHSKVTTSTAKGQTTLFQNWGYYGNQSKGNKSSVILNEDDPITIDDDLQEVDEEVLLAACDQAEGSYNSATAGLNTNPTVPLIPESTPLESLGKTFIAAVVMFNFYRWYPQGKVVFMAPTKPLVAQQIEACFNIMGIPQSDMAEMTGSMAPLDRKKTWKVKRVFFLTPQVLTNDLSRQACPAVDVKCLVVDEAHKALGNHAYCEVVRELSKYTPDFRVLALSATPGGDLKAVQQVLNNLLISHVEIRSEESIDIQRYVHERKVEKIVVPLGEELRNIQKLYLQMLSVYVQRLSRAGALFSKDPAHLSKFQLLRAREAFRQDPPPQVQSKGAVEGDFAIGLSLYHGYELLMQHGTRTLYNFLLNTVSEEKGFSRTRQELMRNGDFVSVMNVLKEKFEDNGDANTSLFGTTGNSPISRKISSTQKSKKFVVSHPKMQKLQEIVIQHFRNHESNASSEEPSTSSSGRDLSDTRVMIFAQYRDSVQEIAAMLNCHSPLVRCMSFVGQSSAGKTTKGISQKEQLRVVKEFRCGNYNTLVSTCVGEEGLDIGDVDLIVCYDAHKSPTRLIYDKSQYSRRGIHKALQGNSKSLQLYPSSPRMIPRGLNPQPHKMHIKVEQYEGNQKRARGVKKKQESSISAYMKTGKDKSKTFLSEEELADWSLKFKLNEEETLSVPVLSSRKVSASKQPVLSLSSWSLWQTKQQPTHLVSHSVKCKNFVELMEFMEVQDQIGGDDIYGMEMALHLNERDVIKEPTGIQKFCQKTNRNTRTEEETSSINSKSDAGEENMDSMENVRRSKKRRALPQLISDESEDDDHALPEIQIDVNKNLTETETSDKLKVPPCESVAKECVDDEQRLLERDVDVGVGRSDETGSSKCTAEEDKKGVKISKISSKECPEKEDETMMVKDGTSETDMRGSKEEPRKVKPERTIDLIYSSDDEAFEGDPGKTCKTNLKSDKSPTLVHNLVQVLKSIGEKKEEIRGKQSSCAEKKTLDEMVSAPPPLGGEVEQVNQQENETSLERKDREICDEMEGNLSSIFPCSQFSFNLSTPYHGKRGGLPLPHSPPSASALPPSPPSASALDALDEIGTQVGCSSDSSKSFIDESEKQNCQNSENTCLTPNEKKSIHKVEGDKDPKEEKLGLDVNLSCKMEKENGSFERVLSDQEDAEPFLENKDHTAKKMPISFEEGDFEDLFADDWSINAEESDIAPADIQTPNFHQMISPSAKVNKNISLSETSNLIARNVASDNQEKTSYKPLGDAETKIGATNECDEGSSRKDTEDKQSNKSTDVGASLGISSLTDTGRRCSPPTPSSEIDDLWIDFGLNFDLRFDLNSLDDENVFLSSPAGKPSLASNSNNGTPASHQSFGQRSRAVSTPLLKQSLVSGTNPSPALTPVTNIEENSCRRKPGTDAREDGSFAEVVPPSVRTNYNNVYRNEKQEDIMSDDTKNTSLVSPTGPVKPCLLRKLSFCNTDILSTSSKEGTKRKDPSETGESPDCKKKKSVHLETAPSESASHLYSNKNEQHGEDDSPVYVSDGNGTQEFQVGQAASVICVSDDEPLSQIQKPKKRCKNVLRSPEDSSPSDVTKLQRKKKKQSRKVLLQSSSDEDFDLTSPINPLSKKKRSSSRGGRRILESDDGDEDEDTSPQVNKVEGRTVSDGRNASVRERYKNQNKRKRRQNGVQRFLDEEVEVSENGSISSDETEGSVLDQSLDGFINDATLASQPSPSGRKDMRAVYMKSIRSPATSAILHPNRNRFKMSHGVGVHGNIYSQVPQQDDTYAEDSFVVEGEEGDHLVIGENGCFEDTINVDNIIGGRGCKRLRNTRQGESKAERILRQGRRAVLKSNSSDEDMETKTEITDKKHNHLKGQHHESNMANSNDWNLREERSTVSSREENIRKCRVIGGLGSFDDEDDDDADDESESNLRINFDLEFESCVEGRGSARDSVTKTTSVFTKEQQQREERLRKQKEKQAEFRKKMAAKRKAENNASKNQCNNRGEESQGFEVTAEKGDMVGSNGSHITPFQNDLSCSGITQKQSTQLNKPCILINSKELSSSSSIVSTLAIKHHMDARVCQLRGCDFMVSMRMGVEKQSLSEFALSSNKTKLVERLKEMQQLFDKVCIIVEKDRVKRDEKPKSFVRTKYFDSTLAALAQTSFKVLFSDSSDETALILADLAQVEARKGYAINFPRELSETQEQVFAFCQSIPGTNYAAALSLTFKFQRLVELINCSEENLWQRTGISKERAKNIFRHFRHEFDEQMMRTPKR
ncbi:Fanconi anemia group M protein [Holothuria leucospilota]|uniref:Fanconi anemia group M protein n=1 Tax=Holothuria leucospilota TaxID=206669 RepID=A0A9Q1HIF2_HOLLE|nr:Fanconi anemia group M protein [Holothuria leucospilota]